MSDTTPSAFAIVPRALMAAVIGMGIAIVVGVGVLAGVIMHRMAAPVAPHVVFTHDVPQAVSPAEQDLTLPVPADTRVASITARRDGSLAVLLEEGTVRRLVIWNPAEGRIVAMLVLQPAR